MSTLSLVPRIVISLDVVKEQLARVLDLNCDFLNDIHNRKIFDLELDVGDKRQIQYKTFLLIQA